MPFFLNLYFQAPKYPLAHVSMQIRTKPRTPSLMALPLWSQRESWSVSPPVYHEKTPRDVSGCNSWQHEHQRSVSVVWIQRLFQFLPGIQARIRNVAERV